jgi:parvulin-like peptidyl-prolyl isomerase
MLKLSNILITLDDVDQYLKKTFQLTPIYQKILYQRIIDQAAQTKEVTITEAEMQAEGDRWRLENRLEKASDTLNWLEHHRLTVEDLAGGIRDRLLAQKLSHLLFDQAVEANFRQHRSNFDQVLLYQIILSDQSVAQELWFQIEEREISFFEAAHLYNRDEGDRQKCGYAGKVSRWQLKPDISAAVFTAQPGQVVGPLQTDQGYHLLLVKDLIPAQLTPEIRQELLDNMFHAWLDQELDYLLHHKISA